jgi:hypothetical protein
LVAGASPAKAAKVVKTTQYFKKKVGAAVASKAAKSRPSDALEPKSPAKRPARRGAKNADSGRTAVTEGSVPTAATPPDAQEVVRGPENEPPVVLAPAAPDVLPVAQPPAVAVSAEPRDEVAPGPVSHGADKAPGPASPRVDATIEPEGQSVSSQHGPVTLRSWISSLTNHVPQLPEPELVALYVRLSGDPEGRSKVRESFLAKFFPMIVGEAQVRASDKTLGELVMAGAESFLAHFDLNVMAAENFEGSPLSERCLAASRRAMNGKGRAARIDVPPEKSEAGAQAPKARADVPEDSERKSWDSPHGTILLIRCGKYGWLPVSTQPGKVFVDFSKGLYVVMLHEADRAAYPIVMRDGMPVAFPADFAIRDDGYVRCVALIGGSRVDIVAKGA